MSYVTSTKNKKHMIISTDIEKAFDKIKLLPVSWCAVSMAPCSKHFQESNEEVAG